MRSTGQKWALQRNRLVIIITLVEFYLTVFLCVSDTVQPPLVRPTSINSCGAETEGKGTSVAAQRLPACRRVELVLF